MDGDGRRFTQHRMSLILALEDPTKVSVGRTRCRNGQGSRARGASPSRISAAGVASDGRAALRLHPDEQIAAQRRARGKVGGGPTRP